MKKTVQMWKEYGWSAIGAAFVAFMAAQVHLGYMIFFPIIVLVIWALYNLVRSRRQPERVKRPFFIKIGLWLLAIATVFVNHWYLAEAARQDGELLAMHVLQFKSQHGAYPKDMEEAGVADPTFGRRWMMGYSFSEGEPYLIYASTFTPFDSYSYDFDSKQWVFHPD